MLSKNLETAIHAALLAGEKIRAIYVEEEHGVSYKTDDSPLTRADSAAHDCIANHLCETNIPLLSEEDARNHGFEERKNWPLCWIVDPLDGTKEFIKRNGEFTVNIALAENGVPTLGVIYAPVPDVLYFAEKNTGAFLIRNTLQHSFSAELILANRVLLPLQALPEICTVVGSRSHASEETDAFVEQLRTQYGSVDFIAAGSSLKFGLIAEGKAHTYPRFAPTMEWDTAAGQIIVEESGGTMIDYQTQKPIQYNREQLRNDWFLVRAKDF
ncbi:MAG: 3'(2'),5'-bisphosphate nucleotidase CysQ [Bacteroidia bacterium]